MAPLTRLFCNKCDFALSVDLDGHSYVVSGDGERVSIGEMPSASKVDTTQGKYRYHHGGAAYNSL